MRAIDADRLLDRCKFYHLPNGDIAVPIIDVQHAPTIETEPHWIPVTERLPEKEGRYLVTNSKIGAWHVDVDFYRPYMGGWMYDQGVTAWMPLPEPYKWVTECVKHGRRQRSLQ